MDDEPSGITGLVIAVVVAMALALLLVPGELHAVLPGLRSGDFASPAGYIFGTSLFVALIVWAVLHFAYLRSRVPERSFDYFLILFAAVGATNLGVIWFVKSNADTRIAAVQAQTEQAEARIDDFRRMQNGLVSSLTDAQTTYHNTVTSLGFPAFLEPSHFAADKSLVRTRAKLEAVRAALRTYRTTRDTLVANFRRSIETSATDATLKRQYLASFDRAEVGHKAANDRVLDLDDRMFVEAEAMTRDLARQSAFWMVTGGRLLFARPQELATYNTHIRNMRTLQSEENAAVMSANTAAFTSITVAQPQTGGPGFVPPQRVQ